MTTEQSSKNKAIIATLQSCNDILDTVDFGKIEVWNWLACQEQNAEADNSTREVYVAAALRDEAESVANFFKSLGFTY